MKDRGRGYGIGLNGIAVKIDHHMVLFYFHESRNSDEPKRKVRVVLGDGGVDRTVVWIGQNVVTGQVSRKI